MTDLTPKQRRFVAEYLVDLNATQAAIRAGYSEHTAKQQGQRLLTNADVADAIGAALKTRSDRTEVTQDQVVRGLMAEAEFKGDGSSHSARVAAWAHLGKHLGIFTDNLNLSGGLQISHEAALEQLK